MGQNEVWGLYEFNVEKFIYIFAVGFLVFRQLHQMVRVYGECGRYPIYIYYYILLQRK